MGNKKSLAYISITVLNTAVSSQHVIFIERGSFKISGLFEAKVGNRFVLLTLYYK